MENLWPIAFGLAILGLIWAVVMTAKFNADREEQRRMNALDAAVAHAEGANSKIIADTAKDFLAFLEGEAPIRTPEPDARPYQLHAHEAV